MVIGISKRKVQIIAAVVLLFVLSACVLWCLFAASSKPEAGTGLAIPAVRSDAPVFPRPHLLVTSVNGKAESLRTGSLIWESVSAGDELFADDRLRTEKNATVRLAVDDKSRFELEGRSELNVEELTATIHQIELALGQISVDYDTSENRILKITASDELDAVAETTAAQFVVQRVGGEVTVATQMGRVKLTAKAESVTVGPQSFSRVSKGSAPMKPEPIPMEVLLKVANPKKGLERDRSTIISGRTNVGAMVLVNDEAADVDETGRFRVAVPLRPGLRQVNVVSNTAWGSAEKQVQVFTVPDDGEVTDAKVKWGTSAGSKTKKKKAN